MTASAPRYLAAYSLSVLLLCTLLNLTANRQIHKVGDNKYAVYSRRLEDHTSKFPDLIACLPQVCLDAGHRSHFTLACAAESHH